MKEQQFTGDWFETLLKGIKSNKGKSDDKRSSPRVGVTMSVDMCFLGEDGQPEKTGTVRVRDVSRAGISFIFPRRIKPQTQFCLSFPRIDESPLLIGYKTSRCRLVSDDLYSVGATLEWIGAPPTVKPIASAAETPQVPAEDEISRIRNAMLR